MDLEFMLSDTLEVCRSELLSGWLKFEQNLRPKMVLAKTFDEAVVAVDAMLASNATNSLSAPEYIDEQDEIEPQRDLDSESDSADDQDEPVEPQSVRLNLSRVVPTQVLQGTPDHDEELVLESPKKPGLTAEEEADFARELAKLMSDNSSAARGPARGRTEVGLPFFRREAAEAPSTKDEQHMVFTMLTRKGQRSQVSFTSRIGRHGNSFQAHAMHIPVDSSIATSTRDQQAQEKLEQQQLKRLVLESEQRQNLEGAAPSGKRGAPQCTANSTSLTAGPVLRGMP
jgi:regulator of nonsense transcripts 2